MTQRSICLAEKHAYGVRPAAPRGEVDPSAERLQDHTSPAGLQIVGLTKRFGERWAARNLHIEVPKGKLLVLLGPSGSGKTSTLNMIAGFLSPDAGRVLVDGEDVTDIPTHKRGFGMVFQASTLFPHLTVSENIEYGLKIRKAASGQRQLRIAEMLSMIGLQARSGAYPAHLSGGEQQRVALARALSIEPRLLLLDEPLSSLDAKLRRQIREEIRTIQLQRGITTVMVTHDQEEALALGDIVAIIDQGILHQADTPENAYRNPSDAFVAGFVGENNLLSGVVETAGPELAAIRLPEAGTLLFASRVQAGIKAGDRVLMVVRPDQVVIGKDDGCSGDSDSADWNCLRGSVRVTQFLGARKRCVVEFQRDTKSIDVDAPPYLNIASGDMVYLRWRRDESRIISAASAREQIG